MNFSNNFADFIPYIVFAMALGIFDCYMLQKHIEEVRKLRDEKAALLEILLAFFRHQASIPQPGKAKSKGEENND